MEELEVDVEAPRYKPKVICLMSCVKLVVVVLTLVTVVVSLLYCASIMFTPLWDELHKDANCTSCSQCGSVVECHGLVITMTMIGVFVVLGACCATAMGIRFVGLYAACLFTETSAEIIDYAIHKQAH
jgi:hypothetical protein